MITRLSIPDAATFSTTDGIYPYYHKYTSPVFKVRYADTPFTVNNNGVSSYWYKSLANATASVATSYSAQLPIVKFYFANGYPPFYSMPDESKRWAAKFKCQFYAVATANYQFAFGGSGLLDSAFIKVDGVAEGTTKTYLKFDNTDYSKTKTYAFNGKTWHKLEFIYDSNKTIGTNVDEYGIIALWKTDSASITPEYIPLSAGVCCCPNSATTANKMDGETVNWVTLPDISDVKYSIGKENIGSLNFSVPFVATTYFTQGGYINNNGNLKHAISGDTIKKYRKVEYYEGYRSATNNKAISFDGSANCKVTVPYKESLRCEGAISIEFWFKVTSGIGSKTFLQMPRFTGGQTDSIYSVYTDTFENFTVTMKDNATTTTRTVSGDYIDGAWHHFVFTADGSYWKCYIDGIRKLNQVETDVPDWTGVTPTIALHLGQAYNAGTGLTRLAGTLDEVRIYNRVIGTSEVEFNANSLNGTPLNSDGLVLWLKMDEGTGTTVSDKSGWSNTGTFSPGTAGTWVAGNVPYIDEFVKKFTGQTKEFENSYSKDGNDSVNVICEDFSSFMKESFNLFSPNPIDYYQAAYFPDNRTAYNKIVNANTKPIAFDGWDVHKFLHIMLTESCIDPYLFYKKKVFSNRAGSKVFGKYKIDMTDATANCVKFPTNTNYGNAYNVDPQFKADDEYIHKIDTGEFYYDAVINALQQYYYNFYFDEHGHPVLTSFNSPVTYMDDRDFTRTSWSDSTSAKFSAYKTTYSSARSYVASANFTGVCADILFLAGPRMGHTTNAATNSVTVDIKYGTTVLETYNINLYSSTVRGVYDGVDNLLGYNPCVYRIGRSLPYDTYKIVVTPKNGYPVYLDGAFIYDKDVEGSLHTFESGDANSKGSLVSLNVETKAKDLRNDVYVYGALQGDLRAYNRDDEYVVMNPNNPIRRYNYSTMRDIASIYSTSAANYVGRPIRLLVQDPKIVNAEQANSVAYNILSTYRNPAKKMNCTVIGNPMLQIDDCITVKDSFKQYASANVWVESISSDISINSDSCKYLTSINTSPIKPPDGYITKTLPALPATGPIQNITTKNSGQLIKLSAYVSTSATEFTIKATPASVGCGYIPDRGYMRLYSTVSGFSSFGGPNYQEEIIYYERKAPSTATASTVLTSCLRGLQGSLAYGHKTGVEFYACFDPYMTEKMSYYPQLSLDVYSRGSLKVGVYGHLNDGSRVLVSNLTGIGKPNGEFGEFDDVEWGRYTYNWNCIDSLGEYNKIATLGEAGAASYVSELERSPEYYDNGYGQQGTFTFDIEFHDKERNIYYATSTQGLGDRGAVYIHRGSVGIIEFQVHSAGLYHYFGSGVSGSEAAAKAVATARNFSSEVNAIYFPYVKTTSNNGDGIKYTIKDISKSIDVDKFEPRMWVSDISCNILHLGRLELINDNSRPVYANITTIKVTDDNFRVLYNSGKGHTSYFNPNTYKSDIPIQLVPSKVISEIKNKLYPSDTTQHKNPGQYIFNNFIFFTGNIYDRSGRAAWTKITNGSWVKPDIIYNRTNYGLIDIFGVDNGSRGIPHKDRNNLLIDGVTRSGLDFLYRQYNVIPTQGIGPSTVRDDVFNVVGQQFQIMPPVLWYGHNDYAAANRYDMSQISAGPVTQFYIDIMAGIAAKNCPFINNANGYLTTNTMKVCQTWYRMTGVEVTAL